MLAHVISDRTHSIIIGVPRVSRVLGLASDEAREGGSPEKSSLQAATRPGPPSLNGHHLTLEDVERIAVVTETYYNAPNRVISLENTLAGIIMPWDDIRAISQWARAQDPPIHMKLDGARLWEAATAGACTRREIGECLDSIQLCLTKGLGAQVLRRQRARVGHYRGPS